MKYGRVWTVDGTGRVSEGELKQLSIDVTLAIVTGKLVVGGLRGARCVR